MPEAASEPGSVPSEVAENESLLSGLEDHPVEALIASDRRRHPWSEEAPVCGRIGPVGEFGFSVIGAAFLVVLLAPTWWWASRGRPVGYDPPSEPRALGIVERCGQVLTSATALTFAGTHLRPFSAWSWWLIAAIVLMVAYLVCWLRYGRSARTIVDFYRRLGPVPVPLATLPVAAFMSLGVYAGAWPLIVASAVLGVGHISIHLRHLSALRAASGR